MPPYVPTPAEIRAACLEIQATWSDAERRRRAAGSVTPGERYVRPEHWTVPEVEVQHFNEAGQRVRL